MRYKNTRLFLYRHHDQMTVEKNAQELAWQLGEKVIQAMDNSCGPIPCGPDQIPGNWRNAASPLPNGSPLQVRAKILGYSAGGVVATWVAKYATKHPESDREGETCFKWEILNVGGPNGGYPGGSISHWGGFMNPFVKPWYWLMSI